jgi:pSer/pThr/pTyr-binding forkhead associated (FHA) protein
LDGEHVNRNHCLFLLDEDGLSIRDLNTTNGTYVNGRRVARGETLRLHDDDIVSVASINERTFRITLGSRPVGTPRATRQGQPSARSLEPEKTDEINRERAKTYSDNLAPLKAVPLGSAPEEPSVLPFLDDNGPRFGAGAAESNPNALTSQLEFAHEPQTARVTLDVVAGPKNGARFEFQQHSTFLVGRGPWTHLCLSEDLHFSRHHLRIEIHPPDCQLIDLGSRNGTFVNGNRVNSTSCETETSFPVEKLKFGWA